MFPGRLELVFGVRLRRGRSVGGRGAGPGFMNWSLEYILGKSARVQALGREVVEGGGENGNGGAERLT